MSKLHCRDLGRSEQDLDDLITFDQRIRNEEAACCGEKTAMLNMPKTVKMERELGDDLVEKIITMMPFPAVFKARCLSKTWQARLSFFSADDEEAKRCLVPSCHRQIFERSSTWNTNWPVFVKKGRLFGYERESQTWRRMPSLSFLPHDEVFESGVPLLGRTMFQSTCMQIEGPLLFTCRLEARHDKCVLFVANILTRIWRPLKLPPLLKEQIFFQKLVVNKSAKAYKLILLGCMAIDHDADSFRTSISMQIYDSRLDAWRTEFLLDPQWTHYPSTAALHKGILYIVSCTEPQDLLAYNLQDGTLQRMESLDFLMNLGWGESWAHNFSVDGVNLLPSKSELLMVLSMWHTQVQRVHSQIEVLRIDFSAGRLLQLATICVEGMKRYTECLMDGNSIILGMDGPRSKRVVQFNLDTAEWSHFRLLSDGYQWLGSCFQPGVNPFMVA